jgi:dihydrofolate reductase
MNHTNRPLISAIVAMAENRVIGKNNQLPWRLPADLRHFKAITTGNPILMGRKTYESIGRPLPNRTNIIITRDAQFKAPGCIVVTSLEDAIRYASMENVREIFIIGGACVYQQLLPHIQRIYLTVIHHVFDGDVYFPELDKKEWKEQECLSHAADEENPYAYSFLKLERIIS